MTIIQQTMDLYPNAKAVKTNIPQAAEDTTKHNGSDAFCIKYTGGNISVSAFCAQLAKKGINIGRNNMIKWLRDNGYLSRQKSIWNMPVQKYIRNGILNYKETFVFVADEQVPKYSPLITPKGRAYFIDKLKSQNSPQEKAN